MAQQSSQQEPTMEEILASIRRIISEDADETAAAPEPMVEPAAQPVQARQPEPEPAEEDVLELDQVVEPEEPVQLKAEPEPPPPPPKPAAQVRPEPRRPRAPEPPAEEDLMLVDEDAPRSGLISQNAASAISSAFGQLHTRTRITDEPGNTLEDIVRQMLQPMLQDWLEQNLPAITERLVAEEIERVQRGTNRRR
jgi:uncharacterized protein